MGHAELINFDWGFFAKVYHLTRCKSLATRPTLITSIPLGSKQELFFGWTIAKLDEGGRFPRLFEKDFFSLCKISLASLTAVKESSEASHHNRQQPHSSGCCYCRTGFLRQTSKAGLTTRSAVCVSFTLHSIAEFTPGHHGQKAGGGDGGLYIM